MSKEAALVRYEDSLEIVSLRLKKLNNMIDSLYIGMQQENIEQQALDCVESIGYCVSDIRNMAVGRLQQIRELQNNMEEKNNYDSNTMGV